MKHVFVVASGVSASICDEQVCKRDLFFVPAVTTAIYDTRPILGLLWVQFHRNFRRYCREYVDLRADQAWRQDMVIVR